MTRQKEMKFPHSQGNRVNSAHKTKAIPEVKLLKVTLPLIKPATLLIAGSENIYLTELNWQA